MDEFEQKRIEQEEKERENRDRLAKYIRKMRMQKQYKKGKGYVKPTEEEILLSFAKTFLDGELNSPNPQHMAKLIKSELDKLPMSVRNENKDIVKDINEAAGDPQRQLNKTPVNLGPKAAPAKDMGMAKTMPPPKFF